MDYETRCRHYLHQRGIAITVHELLYPKLTPAQRRRAFKKERQTWAKLRSSDGKR